MILVVKSSSLFISLRKLRTCRLLQVIMKTLSLDCGQPQTPVLVPGEGASVLCKETSGMLMPAASAVRIANSGSVVYGSGTSYTQSSGNTVG